MRKACMPFLTVVVLLALAVGGCKVVSGDADAYRFQKQKADRNKSVLQEKGGASIYGEVQKSEYGYRKMCERAFRRGEENIFCSRKNLCKEVISRVTFDKHGEPVTGMVDDINFVREFCQ